MLIEVVKVEPIQQLMGKNNKPYQSVEVVYKDASGKIGGKKLMSFQAPEVFQKLSRAMSGEKFNVRSEKVGQYWNWTGFEDAAAQQATTSESSWGSVSRPPGKVVGSNYATKEERDQKDQRISRLAVLNTAVALAAANGDKKATPDTVIEVAEKFEKWVTREAAVGDPKDLSNIDDDIPY